MAYKEETDQQFMESIFSQMQRPNRPNRSQLPSGFQKLDTDSNSGNQDVEFDRTPDDMTTGPQLRRHLGPQPPEQPQRSPFASIKDRLEQGKQADAASASEDLKSILREIKSKEAELHELQQQKIALQRTVNGRL